MSPVRPAAGRFAPRIRSRKLAGAAFGLACLLATLTGVVVLTVLLASVVAAALRSPAGAPWHAAGSPARELVGFLRHLTGRFGSRVPTKAGFRAGIAGSVWLLALVAAIAIPVGVGAAVFL
ncbi:MAG TPA: phosphate ABC transporter, permease protein PstA, partial [Isosphaeraceae bacterium]